MLDERAQQIVSVRLAELERPVRLVMFTQEMECEYCRDTRNLVTELARISPSVEAEIHDFVTERDLAQQYGIDKIPAIAVLGERDYGIRFFGFPGGYEFGTLIDIIGDVARGDSGLQDSTRSALARLDQDVHLQVFTTPT
jgi:alkyl hydroperoxide reductase subunit AhpF